MTITTSDTSRDARELLEASHLERSRLVVVAMEECQTGFDVATASAELIKRVRTDAADGLLEGQRTIIVLSVTPDADPIQRQAVVFSFRGIVQSVTREFAHRAQSINVIVVDSNDLAAALPTLDYLDDPDGGYTAGFTFDLATTEAPA